MYYRVSYAPGGAVPEGDMRVLACFGVWGHEASLNSFCSPSRSMVRAAHTIYKMTKGDVASAFVLSFTCLISARFPSSTVSVLVELQSGGSHFRCFSLLGDLHFPLPILEWE